MCGIVGAVGRACRETAESVVRMRDTLRHRGPDHAGIWISADRSVALGHRRLSILDLSVAGGQPMSWGEGHLQIVFNGEIYNFLELREDLARRGHVFKTRTDTEVILASFAEWGMECVKFIVGMFAFAIYDAHRRKLFIARDRVGEKPLFYAHQNGRLLFGSEIKALFADRDIPRRMDLQALDHFLAFGYVPGSHCIVAGIQKLPPAHTLEYDIGRDVVTLQRYWSLPPTCHSSGDVNSLADELESLLENSIRCQLVADVPVGILLSGGLDSSLITAIAAKQSSRPIRTFTVSFPGHKAYDEGPHAIRVAKHFGTDHLELAAEPASIDLLPILARQYDEPIADSSMVPTYLVSQLVRQHCTVALGGDGGDELFGGYELYRVVQAQQLLRAWTPAAVRRLVYAAAKRRPVGSRGRSYAMNIAADPRQAVAHTGIYLDRMSRETLVPALQTLSTRAEEHRLVAASSSKSIVQQLTTADFSTYLPDDILVKVDRASMLASLEVRAPFLDYRIVEFAFSKLPDRLRTTLFHRKVLLRHLARRLLPPDFDLKRKQGFSIPLTSWFEGRWGTMMCDVLASAKPGLWDAGSLQNLISLQRAGFSNSHRLFAITMLELWRREYDIEAPLPWHN